MSRQMAAEIVQVLGIALVTAGVAAVYWPAALIVAGGALVVLAQGVR